MQDKVYMSRMPRILNGVQTRFHRTLADNPVRPMTVIATMGILLLTGGTEAATAQKTAADSTSVTPTAKKAGYTIIPGLKISPEIGIGVGMMAVNPQSPREGARMEYRLLYTTRGQAEARISNRTTEFFGSQWEARFEGSFQRFPDSYFGGGNNPNDSDETEYSPLGGYAFTYFTRPIVAAVPPIKFIAGVRAEFWDISDIHKADGSLGASQILGPQVSGYRGGLADLWESGIEYDARDSKDVPARGIHASQRIGTSIAAKDAFRSSESWIAAYQTLGRRWEVAGKLWQKTLFGNPAFFVEPNLGNEDVLRGVPHKRFRDKSAQAAQAEIRFGFPLALPLIAGWLGKDWQIATFGETGRVDSDFEEASQGTLHYSGGVGGRLVFNNRVGCMRGDLGFSEHGVAFIVKFNQAF